MNTIIQWVNPQERAIGVTDFTAYGVVLNSALRAIAVPSFIRRSGAPLVVREDAINDTLFLTEVPADWCAGDMVAFNSEEM